MTEGKKEKKKISWGWIIYLLACMLFGVLIGVILGEANIDFDFVHIPVMIIFLIFAMYLHIILHEGGHMIAGMMTGYGFLSFRVGSLMWEKKNDGRIRFSRFSLAGTGGQCLMQPPAYDDGRFPYVLYNLGGGLANFIIAAICGLLLMAVKSQYAVMFLWIMLLSGILLGAANLIPLKTQTVNNDGSNIAAIGKSQAAKRAFWLQMQCNYCIAMGQRLKDMPDEWFPSFPDEERKNVMVTTMDVLACNRLMDQMEFGVAEEKMLALVDDAAVAGIYRNLLVFEIAFCQLLRGKTDGYVQKMAQKELAAFAKAMKNFPPILRTQYAKALLADHDAVSAGKILAVFEKMAKNYPRPNELEGEKELMQLADAAARQNCMDA